MIRTKSILGTLFLLATSVSILFAGSTPFVEDPVNVGKSVSVSGSGSGGVGSKASGTAIVNIRVAGYNIAHARGNESGWQNERGKLKNLRGIADMLKKEKVDIIGFTEISCHDIRVGLIDQPKYIAKRLGFNYKYHENVSHGWFGILATGGNAVVSRFPILSSVKHNLFSTDPKNEPRGCVEAVLDLGKGKRLRVFVAHLSLKKEESSKQVEEIWAMVEKSAEPVILVGDFNLRPHSEPVKLLSGKMKDCTSNLTSTYMNKPGVKIDYHFIHGDITGGNARVVGFDEGYSDHGCVINDYRLTK